VYGVVEFKMCLYFYSQLLWTYKLNHVVLDGYSLKHIVCTPIQISLPGFYSTLWS